MRWLLKLLKLFSNDWRRKGTQPSFEYRYLIFSSCRFEIVTTKTGQLTLEQACQWYQEHKQRAWFDDVTSFMASGPCMAVAVRKENAIAELRSLCGPTDPLLAKKTAPDTLRAYYGRDSTRNAVHSSDSSQSSAHELDLIDLFFAGEETALLLIKPDAAASNRVAIIERFQHEGFTIDKNVEFVLPLNLARIFYGTGTVPSSGSNSASSAAEVKSAHLASGRVTALALRRKAAIRHLKLVCGPVDPLEAKKTAPNRY
jgi:nucleoside diphosphate kinase